MEPILPGLAGGNSSFGWSEAERDVCSMRACDSRGTLVRLGA